MEYDLEKIQLSVNKALSLCNDDEKDAVYDALSEMDDVNLLNLLDTKEKINFDKRLNNDERGSYTLNTGVAKVLHILKSEEELLTIISFVKNYYVFLKNTLNSDARNVLLPTNINIVLGHLENLEVGKGTFGNDSYYILVGLVIYGYTKFKFKG